MTAQELANAYMAQSSSCYSISDYDEHTNGHTHTNSSGHHADSKPLDGSGHSGPGHGDYYDLSYNY